MSSIPTVTPTHGARVQFVVKPHAVEKLSSKGTPDSHGPAVRVEISKHAQAALTAKQAHTTQPGDRR